MFENPIVFLSSETITPFLILTIAFFFQYMENIFPPLPSDVVLLFIGSLSGLGRVDFFQLFLIATVGSTLGFLTMFIVGKYFGEKIIDKGKIKYLSKDNIEKVRLWLNRWGYWIVVGNRFLSGTRAIVSFLAGLAELSTYKSIILAGISASLWNFIILYLGFSLGKNWQLAVFYIELYWRIVIAIIFLILTFLGIYFLVIKKRTK
ncbi:MAG: DedA family protein [Candidatus Kapaibacteriales bacterium]